MLTLRGYAARRFEYGFWYHVLYDLYPKKVTFYGFSVKLFFFHALAGAAVIIHPLLFFFPVLFLAWFMLRNHVFRGPNAVAFCLSKFSSPGGKILALLVAIVAFGVGELSAESGKLWALFKSPVHRRRSIVPVHSGFMATAPG